MAKKTAIASLYVDLQANTAQFIKELDKSRTKATIFGVAVGHIMADVAKGVGRMAADAALALPRLAQAGIDMADELNKAAQKTGTTVETLSALRHAAELADLPFESLTTGIGRLSKQMAAAASGSKESAGIFSRMGIAAANADGSLRPVNDVLADVAERFATMQDGAEKTALAMEIFGKSGQQLIPFLNQGRAGLAAMTEEAEKLNLVISGETAARAEQFNDNLSKLSGAVSGFGRAIAAELLGPLVNLTNALVEFAKSSTFAVDAAKAIGGVFQFLASNTVALAGYFQSVVVTVKTLDYWIVKLGNTVGVFSDKYLEDVDRGLTKAQDNFYALADLATSLSKITVSAPQITGADKIGAQLAGQVKQAEDLIKAASTRTVQTISASIGTTLDEGTTFFEIMAASRDKFFDQYKTRLNEIGAKWQEQVDLMPSQFPQTKELYEGVAEAAKVAAPEVKKLTEETNAFAQAVSSGLEDAMRHWEGFGKLVTGILDDIAATILRNQVTAPLSNWLGDLFGGGGGLFSGLKGIGGKLAGIFGGFRAGGGDVMAGHAYVVGERQPELFVPSSDGTILPSTGSNSSITVNQTVNLNGSDQRGMMATARQIAEETAAAVLRAQREMQLRGA